MFEFLKYIHPIWYYRLGIENSDFNQMLSQLEGEVQIDSAFSCRNSQRMECAYRALQIGCIPKKLNSIGEKRVFSVVRDRYDNYRFIGKYFGLNKLIYILVLRIFTLNNPILEFFGFFKGLRVKRLDVTKNHLEHAGFDSFESKLLKINPLISVVIPTLNRYEYLKDVFADLEKQDYYNFEVLVCDQTDEIPAQFYDGWNIDLKLIKQTEKALWLARNTCIQQAKGEYILLFDDDSRVEANWISSHLKCLDYFDVKISAGVTHTLRGHGLGKKEKYFHLSDVFDTGNSMVHIDVFKEIGLFDRQFEKMRMGDGEFGLRSILAGYLVVSNPYATRIHLKVKTGGLREMGSWDAIRPKSLFAPRPVPSVLYFTRKYFGNTSARYYLIQNIPFSFIPYKFKSSKFLKLIFLFLLPILLVVMIIVVLKSWKISTKMIFNQSKIQFLYG